MVVVGLTGGIGSGKTTVLQLFQELGVASYIADKEAKRLMSNSTKIKEDIIQEFGNRSYTVDGLNRKYLAEIVFKNPERLETLNNIVHPQVHKDFKRFIKNVLSDYVVYESAILFESNGAKLCDLVITVSAPIELRIERVIARDNATKTAILNRMKNQLSDEDKIAKSNFVIENIDLNNTGDEVIKLHKKILQWIKIHNK